MAFRIDFVLLWVDGADEAWLKKKNATLVSLGREPADNSASRYRDWGMLPYWFRSVETHAPWVDHIFVVTDHQAPSWLKKDHPKLRFVNHEDFIPKQFLPTFCSYVIEMNLHRIPDLSEHFVLFNDDCFLNRAARPEDFFKEGLPCYTYCEEDHYQNNFSSYNYALFNGMILANRYHPKSALKKKAWGTIFHPSYGIKTNLKNLQAFSHRHFLRFRDYHSSFSLRKSTLQELWEKEPDYMARMCSHHFREYDGVNPYLAFAWELSRGTFAPVGHHGKYYSLLPENCGEWESDIREGIHNCICLNDPDGADYDRLQPVVCEALASRYPRLSSFEIEG